MPIREIVHDEHGIYGKPDELGGSIFWTSGLDTTSAIYIDDNTGNTITIETDNDKYIKLIKYEFQEF